MVKREADDLSDEEVAATMAPWRNELLELIEEKGVDPPCPCVHNADQTERSLLSETSEFNVCAGK